MGGSAIVTVATLQSSVYLKQTVSMYPVYYNAGRSIYLCAADANSSYIDFRCIDTSTAGPDIRIQASGGTAGSTLSSNLSFYGNTFFFNGDVSTNTHNFTCGALTCTTGTLGGNTIATTNLIPSLTGYLRQAQLLFLYTTILEDISV